MLGAIVNVTRKVARPLCLCSMRLWPGYASLLTELKRSYRVQVQTLDAANFRVPQQRRRLFVICDRDAHPQDLSGQVITPPATVSEILDFSGSWPAKPLFKGSAPKQLSSARVEQLKPWVRGFPFSLCTTEVTALEAGRDSIGRFGRLRRWTDLDWWSGYRTSRH